MFKHLLMLALATPILLAEPVAPAADPVAAATALIQRVLPEHAASFVCELMPQDGGRDVFEIKAQGEKILLRGNLGTSLAMAFNWYLRHECKVN
ncbi:MAG: alpha-N-acetylglucosaminidase N-terminal domain-containing protein, partial [Verrucomicrobiota bacterium]